MEPISTALLAAAAKETAGPLFSFLKSGSKNVYDDWAFKFQSSFQGHIDATFARCSKIKNILYRDESVEFITQYVNINFELNDKTLSDEEALNRVNTGLRTLISGTAGAGKTMFMRWSALRLIENMSSYGRIPLYLEMRFFEPDDDGKSLEEYIYSKTSSAVDQSDRAQFDKGLDSGIFFILLDAIDEVPPQYRDQVIGGLVEFLVRYPKVGLMVSSRYDQKLESIQELSVLRSVPMDLDQVVSVIGKLEYDSFVKDKLIARLQSGLYNELEEFLSNPLLATIMLLTFDHSADIPTKLTSFYQQAFEALYQRHDSAKGAYKRDHHAGLPLDRFEEIFSAFSFQTYIEYKFEFSDGSLLEAIRHACDYVQDQSDPELIVKDCMESVCLIQRDGLYNIFSHRSFQEYFCARFISKYREDDVCDLIETVAGMDRNSSVLRMIYELSPEVFEYEWALPILDKFLDKFGRVQPASKAGLTKIMKSMFSSIAFSVDDTRVKTISWDISARVAEGRDARWMSAMRGATNDAVWLVQPIFKGQLWKNMDEFVASLPDDAKVSAAELRRRANSQSDGAEPMIPVDWRDASWLIYSTLPARLSEIVQAVRKYRDEIVARREARKASVVKLLSRPMSARGRHR